MSCPNCPPTASVLAPNTAWPDGKPIAATGACMARAAADASVTQDRRAHLFPYGVRAGAGGGAFARRLRAARARHRARLLRPGAHCARYRSGTEPHVHVHGDGAQAQATFPDHPMNATVSVPYYLASGQTRPSVRVQASMPVYPAVAPSASSLRRPVRIGLTNACLLLRDIPFPAHLQHHAGERGPPLRCVRCGSPHWRPRHRGLQLRLRGADVRRWRVALGAGRAGEHARRAA